VLLYRRGGGEWGGALKRKTVWKTLHSQIKWRGKRKRKRVMEGGDRGNRRGRR